jgi:hypothetical protein
MTKGICPNKCKDCNRKMNERWIRNNVASNMLEGFVYKHDICQRDENKAIFYNGEFYELIPI